jgi:Uma2 family endonuclease
MWHVCRRKVGVRNDGNAIEFSQQAVEVYRRDEEPFWMLSPYKEHDTVMLSSLNISIPIDAIYKNIILPKDTSL